MRRPALAPRWRMAVVAVTSLAIVVLSVLPAWLLHERSVGGHGLTTIRVVWSAWEGRAWPFLPVATVVAGGLAAAAAVNLARPGSIPRSWMLLAAGVVVAILGATVLPLERIGSAETVHLTPFWALGLSTGLALAALAALAAGWVGPRFLLLGGGALVVLLAATYGGRVLALDLAEGNPRHWANGAYVREATASQPEETLTIRDGRFSIGDRWSGSIEDRGLRAVLTSDPACPDDRGAYLVFAEGDGAIRWHLIVDLCADGGRGEDLTTGIWRRVP